MYIWGFLAIGVLGLVVAGLFAPVLWIPAAVLIVVGVVAAIWSAKRVVGEADDPQPPR